MLGSRPPPSPLFVTCVSSETTSPVNTPNDVLNKVSGMAKVTRPSAGAVHEYQTEAPFQDNSPSSVVAPSLSPMVLMSVPVSTSRFEKLSLGGGTNAECNTKSSADLVVAPTQEYRLQSQSQN